ncbi:hypothetical protein MHU86_7071 [Fragilaria crotonensis]|nr:hypothetical protein MHU86_7071 [Fragilaria crotonensis]
MTFGGAPNPTQWSEVSEVITDLANDLVRRSDWDPKVFHSPHQHLLASDEAVDNDKGMVDRSSEFGEANFFVVNYPIANDDDLPRFDCYLDDIFGAFNPKDAEKSSVAIPLPLHIVGRPHDAGGNELFPRDNILAIPKFLAEAKPSERKRILGWMVDTRCFTVALPEDKHQAWTKAIDKLLASSLAHVMTKDLEKTLGRLSHAASIVPYSRHFMGRLYKACKRLKRSGKTRLTDPQREDLSLWRSFLRRAAQGIFINRLVCRWPTRIVRVDACPQGIGGYCLHSGIAWRYQLPEDLAGRATLNTLEFLAAFVGMVVEFRKGKEWSPVLDVLLSQGDRTSAAGGWLAKSSFDDNCLLHLTIARTFADFCLTHEIDHYSTHNGSRGERTRCRTFYRETSRLTTPRSPRSSENMAHSLSTELQDHPLAASPHFAYWRLAATAAQNAALADSTHATRSSSWSCYERFLERIGVNLDPFLRRFAAALWDGPLRSRQPTADGNGAMSGTIRVTLDGMAQTFRLNILESPIHNAAGRLDPFWLYN